MCTMCTNKDKSGGDPSRPWPLAAASRVRIKARDGDAHYCRLFRDPTTGAVELVRCADDDDERRRKRQRRPKRQRWPREVYDDSEAGIADEPAYRSYLAQAQAGSKEGRAVLDSFHPDDVIGARLSLECNASNPNTFHGMERYAAARIDVYTYPRSPSSKKNGKGLREARHRSYVLDPACCEDFGDARKIVRCIKRLSELNDDDDDGGRPPKYLVILNPFSGGGGANSKSGARNVYANVVKPMLDEAGIEHDALVTRRGGHARERMDERRRDDNDVENGGRAGATRVDEDDACALATDDETADVTSYDAIIAMGGDGILFEILQGINARSDASSVMSTTKFGIVACGTFNGLAASILHWSDAPYDHVESAFQFCKGRTSILNVAEYAVLSTKGDDDREKERPRYVSFLSYAWGLIADVDYESECLRWLGPLRSDAWAAWRGVLNRRRYRARLSYLPPGVDDGGDVVMPTPGNPLPDGWASFEEDFIVFWACITTHAGYNVYSCPMSKMNDGLFHIIVVRSSCSRLKLIQMLLKLESGGHVDCEDCEVIDCLAYQLEQLDDVSYNVLDGELLEDGPVQARFVPGGARFFVGV